MYMLWELDDYIGENINYREVWEFFFRPKKKQATYDTWFESVPQYNDVDDDVTKIYFKWSTQKILILKITLRQ